MNAKTLASKIDSFRISPPLLLERAGMSYDALALWRNNDRRPRRQSVGKIVAALRDVGVEANALADELEKAFS